MAALRKALYALFGGKVPHTEAELLAAAPKLFDDVSGAVESDGDDISKQDLYNYLVLNSEAGISSRSVDKLWAKVDVNKDGSISKDEFIKVLRPCWNMLKEEKDLEERLGHTIPDNIVVRGSCRMNALSQTRAFGTQVVRRKSMQRLWALFQEVDMDSDGKLSLGEFKKYMSKRRPNLAQMSASIFYSMDKQRKGSLSFKQIIESFFPVANREEVRLMMRMARPSSYLPQAKPDEKIMEEIRNVFMVYDDDHSGTLDGDEFVHAMQLLGFSPEEVVTMFKEIDQDGSGEISYDEFEAWYVNNHRKQMRVLQDAERDSDDEGDY